MAAAGEAVHPGEGELLRVAEDCDVDKGRGREIVQHVQDAVRSWPRFARTTGVSSATERRIGMVIAKPAR
jgi:hypothetical protein